MTTSNPLAGEPVKQEKTQSSVTYELASLKAPRLGGRCLKAAAVALESPLGTLLMPFVFRATGVTRFRARNVNEAPMFFPAHESHPPSAASFSENSKRFESPASPARSLFREATARYLEKNQTPLDAAQRFLDAVDKAQSSERPLNAFKVVFRKELLEDAQAATERYRQGRPLGPLDGVLIAVKDELDVACHPTTAGSAFVVPPAQEDSTVVTRLKQAGALIVGKTVMHEIGLGVTGLNLHQGTPLNPRAPDRYPGGSSSGSASAVAAGLCAGAIAADGGGSIRIPASFCGLYGLKPTYGRVSEAGAFPLCWSVAHIGPITTTASDLAVLYQTIAGPDPRDPNTLRQPAVNILEADRTDLSGVTLGYYPRWFYHAEPEVVRPCEVVIERLMKRGARICELQIPDLESARIAHAVTITTEMAQAMERFGRGYYRRMGTDVRLHLAIARRYAAADYIQAQRIRARLIATFGTVFQSVDILITPTSAILPPLIRDGALERGECDLSALTEIMRFVTPANLAGLPAISVPAGETATGVPVGLQGIAAPWNEALLLRLASTVEALDRSTPEARWPERRVATASPSHS